MIIVLLARSLLCGRCSGFYSNTAKQRSLCLGFAEADRNLIFTSSQESTSVILSSDDVLRLKRKLQAIVINPPFP